MATKEPLPTTMKMKERETGQDTPGEICANGKPASKEEQQGSWANFTLFPRLPIELRLVVWQLALPNRQLFIVNGTCKLCRVGRSDDALGCMGGHPPVIRSASNSRLSISQANRESRQVALQHQEVVPLPGVFNHPITIKFSQDIFFFENELIFEEFLTRFGKASPKDILNLQRIEQVMIPTFPNSSNLWADTIELFRKLPGLRRLGVVFEKGKPWLIGSRKFVTIEDSRKGHEAYLEKVLRKVGNDKFPAVTMNLFETDADGYMILKGKIKSCFTESLEESKTNHSIESLDGEDVIVGHARVTPGRTRPSPSSSSLFGRFFGGNSILAGRRHPRDWPIDC